MLAARRVGIVAHQLIDCRRAANLCRFPVVVGAVGDARRPREVAEAGCDLRRILRVEDARAVVLLAEPIAGDAHRLGKASERPVDARVALRDLCLLDMHVVQAAHLIDGGRRVVLLSRREYDFGVDVIRYTVARADAQPLPHAVIGTIRVVRRRLGACLRLLRLAHLRTVVAAVTVHAQAVVAEDVEAALFPAVRRNGGAGEEPVRTVDIPERHAFRIDEQACFISRIARAEDRAEVVELRVHAEAERAVVIGAVIVLMIEEVVDARIDGEVLRDVLLDEQVPNTEALLAVFAAHALVVAVDVFFKEIVRLHGIAVEHAAVVAAPEGGADAVRLVLVVHAEVKLVHGTVEQAARQIGVARVDGAQPCVAELRAPVLVELMLHLRLDARDLRLADVPKAVDAVWGAAVAPTLEVEVDELPREVVRHVVRDLVVEDADLRIGLFILALK